MRTQLWSALTAEYQYSANSASMELRFTFPISSACNQLHYVITHNPKAFVPLHCEGSCTGLTGLQGLD